MSVIINELGNIYGDLEVIEITDFRERTNGCVKWKCRCRYCGGISIHNGNNLRFSTYKACQLCNPNQKRRHIQVNEKSI